MAEKKNKVGRPRNTYGKDTLLNHKKSFKLDKNIVFDKWLDMLIVVAIILIVLCAILYIGMKALG